MSKVISVDLGGTNLRVALVKKNKILKYIKKSTPKEKNALLKELTNTISQLITKDIKAIGVGCPGPLENGIIKNPPNLPLKNFNLKKFLEKKFRKKVVIENDAKCVALAEAKLGCRKKNFFILTLGTGIGGGIIIDGKLYKGEGYAGEVGHIILNGEKDFETLWQENRKKCKEYFGEDILIKDLLKMKNEKAEKILDEASVILGKGIASLIDVLDPEVVILMGGVREAGQVFLNMLKKQTQKYTLLPKVTKISWSRLDHPGILGASLLVG